jgi:hypothetical protein
MKHEHIDTATGLVTTSMVGAVAHYATLYQPIISDLAGIVAILSGLAGLVYYVIKIKKQLQK